MIIKRGLAVEQEICCAHLRIIYLSAKKKYGKADVVTAFNVFAHADNMEQMAEGICHLLSKEGVFIFEFQYLLDIIDKMLLGTIFHEHMSHHSLLPSIH